MEQASPLFSALKARHPNAVGSEFLRDGTPPGKLNAMGLQHEDATALTFASGQFDYVLSFDVLEHVPDYSKAFAEIARCLRVGGSLLLTVPFSLESPTHVERARVVNGQIEHLLPPEYHDDILDPNGALCYWHFGWEVCEELRSTGFQDAALYFYWSRELGYLGGWPFLMASR
jgi:SAM-dependent methyltransferase